ncbi:ribosome maturation factor RimM [Sulfurovum sp.]|jgi:16S rRNA processing protein RimM|uniref:ribosome maturation factor RimM n=1 Tax=Sulfurovum sp. TaxID=1969726 RepID=UPI002A3639A8|nr:ribosome maturation factor RimM [Sulfurovum sp.]MDD2451509.1 ribosome maturation factor RimM [Sulfurovum sp.]MDD3499536.1 ribosome maturation factor RimM [Sulfurovum sp.]MDY0403084.1 ribosome maturation factor RimM [Sulfurovum sp.]
MEKFFIAQVGRTVGLWGDLKIHLHTDFPEQFKVGQTYHSDRGELTLSDINPNKGTVRFQGYESLDAAKRLTNAKIYATEAETKANCALGEGEHFWFDIIGCKVMQGDELLGEVEDIQRMLDVDYLAIKTDAALLKEGFAKNFLLPYIPRYILNADTDKKTIFTQDAKDILEAS